MTTIGAFAIIRNEKGAVLCVHQNYKKKRWSLPGGRVELGESIGTAAKRETLEETGYEIEVLGVTGVYSGGYRDDYVVCVEGRIVRDTGVRADPGEISEIGFFAPDALPADISHRAALRIKHAVAGERGMLFSADNEDEAGHDETVA